MTNLDDLKQVAKDTFETISDFSSETLKLAEDKAKTLARRAKLTANITKHRTVIRRKHIDIGIAYYKLFKDAPDESLKESCEAITASLQQIAAMEKELEEIRNRAYAGSKAGCSDSSDEADCCCEDEAQEDPGCCEGDTKEDACCGDETATEECCENSAEEEKPKSKAKS